MEDSILLSMNKNTFRLLIALMALYLIPLSGWSQTDNTILKGWHLLDKTADGFSGISLKKAQELMKGKTLQPVIVAVLDGGIDTTHEDLRSMMWKNNRELAGNLKDDDGNGLVDDVYGWNYLGNSDGMNISKENLEAVRMYHQLKGKFEGKNIEEKTLHDNERRQYEVWKQAMSQLEVSPEDKFNFRMIVATRQSMAQMDTVLQKAMNKPDFSLAELVTLQPNSNEAKRAKFSFVRTTQMFEMEQQMTNTEIFKDLDEYLSKQESLINAKDIPFINYRTIVGDNPSDFKYKLYGNSDVMGSDAKHGTHVAGIIGAASGNTAGMDGVASNALLMTLRVVPDGDEYDKDIALGIRYAVDHGAKVINMSFGKDVSPNQDWVEDAILYAASKDVLLVHAAGNDSKNIDSAYNFPTARMKDSSLAANMITVGASGDPQIKGGLIASFTNYGKTMVDVFAPGVKIYSTIPTTNKYGFLDGTSMASPVVSGIATLIRGYYPGLTATEVKAVLMESVDSSMQNEVFPLPGNPEETISIEGLCVSGGIVNAYSALKLAGEKWEQKAKLNVN